MRSGASLMRRACAYPSASGSASVSASINRHAIYRSCAGYWSAQAGSRMPERFPFLRPRLLSPEDPVIAFDCGVEALTRYLQKHALQAQQGEGARTYVSLCETVIAGYYTLAYGSVEPQRAPLRVGKGLARHPVPVMLLARLAVDRRFQGRGLGAELLRDALLRALAAADIAGLRAIVVDAKDEDAKRFYERYGFEPFPGDPLRLALLTKDARALISKSGPSKA